MAAAVFSLAVDGDGIVTQTQLGAIDHDDDVTYDGAYLEDIQALADGKVELAASAVTTDSEGDVSTEASATLDLGGNVQFGDDGPTLEFGNLVGTTTQTTQTGYWSSSPGADGLGGLAVTVSSTLIIRDPGGSTSTGTATYDNVAQTGTIAWDSDDDPGTPDQVVGFSLVVNPNGTYDFALDEVISQPVVFDSSQGELAPGGPDAVQTLNIFEPETSIVFFGVDLGFDTDPGTPGIQAPDADDVLAAVLPGVQDYDEAGLQALAGMLSSGTSGDGTFGWINQDEEPNVSNRGIGTNNNLLQGADQGGVDIDESFVINPVDPLSRMTVEVDRVKDYDPATEIMTAVVYYVDGTYASFTVGGADVPYDAGTDTFTMLSEPGGPQIDAVQLTMVQGVVRIDKIVFETREELSGDDFLLEFTAELMDGDGDSAAPETFQIELNGRDVESSYDVVMVDSDDGGDTDRDAFNIDVNLAGATDYLITGFDGEDVVNLLNGTSFILSTGDFGEGDAGINDTRIIADEGATIIVADASLLGNGSDVFVF